MNPPKITIHAIVSAEPEKVWDDYTQPDKITQWNFATDDWRCPSASNDMRVGGKYVARMEAKDGSFGFDFEAIYDEIIEGEKFTYTMPDGRQVDVRFDRLDDQTNVTISFDPESQNPIDLQRDGWQAILNNFKAFSETN